MPRLGARRNLRARKARGDRRHHNVLRRRKSGATKSRPLQHAAVPNLERAGGARKQTAGERRTLHVLGDRSYSSCSFLSERRSRSDPRHLGLPCGVLGDRERLTRRHGFLPLSSSPVQIHSVTQSAVHSED